MKKLFCLIILPLFSLIHLHGEEIPTSLEECKDIKTRYGYFTYGFGLPGIFGLNVGIRSQHNHHGFEYGVGAVPFVFAYEVHAFTSYLYYPSPSLDAQAYIGLGLRGGYANVIESRSGKGASYVAPGMIFGKSYQSDSGGRFFQVAVSPAALIEKKIRLAPSISISYGYCF